MGPARERHRTLGSEQITGLRLAKWKWGRKWELSAITKCLCDSGG